ncbi:Vitamin K epoxide reductase family protein [Palleronia marisminoris]|uniref:vitamin K epoxide reductase family protein n=1 Tax=Palleronia marisminoris TaxID=315423 RepID=UPI0008E278FB|nr:vitamin K epoxide reductase family protein [Palleronia marisminoris]SFH26955.1 Vitamin K epoxide reductase family protein [Palleronia marisminoris]
MSLVNRLLGYSTDELRHDIRRDAGAAARRRRGVVVASLLGIAAIGATTLLQMGLVRRLPDPPVRGFKTKHVNLSDEAFSYGRPDSPVVVFAHAFNMVLAATGGCDRARRAPLVPLLAGTIAGAQAAMAAKYLFHDMPYVDEAWCPYCITDALTHFTTFGLTLPEAIEASRILRGRF